MTQNWTLGYYLIAYLDVLCQRQEVLRLDRLPANAEQETLAGQILKNTAGRVMNLRQQFLDLFEALSRPTGLRDKLPPDKRRLAEMLSHHEVEVRGVSDSIIITVPLANENEHYTPIRGVLAALFGVCGIFTAALADGVPLRGGVDIGPGVRITCDEVYGAALVRAVSLEDSMAKYPRVVIGDSLWHYMSDVVDQTPTTVFGERAKDIAGQCKELITKDHDGLRMLDVIGHGAQAALPDGIKQVWVGRAYKYAVEKHEQFKKSGDAKLHPRYGRLRSYLESRLNLWGIKPTPTSE